MLRQKGASLRAEKGDFRGKLIEAEKLSQTMEILETAGLIPAPCARQFSLPLTAVVICLRQFIPVWNG
ncbi:MAG TPA: hypothetical protein VN281_04440 [Verrucomicrobiae bacterium]|nr:hypothetical protein [Verrucomicrobiae bacterium]